MQTEDLHKAGLGFQRPKHGTLRQEAQMRWPSRDGVAMAAVGEYRRLCECLTGARHMNPDASAGLRMAQEVDLTVGHERQPRRIVALPK